MGGVIAVRRGEERTEMKECLTGRREQVERTIRCRKREAAGRKRKVDVNGGD